MRLCVVLLTGLGDVVHGLPVVNAIRSAQPDVHVTWIAEPMPAQLLQPHVAVNEVVVFHKSQGVTGVRQLWHDLRARDFDVTLNFNIYFKSVFPTLFSRAPRRVGFDRARTRDGVWLAANEHLQPRPRRHTQDMFLEFLEPLCVAAGPLAWRLTLTPAELAEQEAFFAPLRGRPIVGIVVASANPKKDWPTERYPPLVAALTTHYGVHVVLLGGPGGREQAIARTIAATQPQVAWGLSDSVRRLVWLIGACDLIIAPDTGPVHIARALEVPVIGLYGHTNPWRVGPYRRYEDLWIDKYTEPGDAPDPGSFEPKHGRMERIEVDEVLARVARLV